MRPCTFCGLFFYIDIVMFPHLWACLPSCYQLLAISGALFADPAGVSRQVCGTAAAAVASLELEIKLLPKGERRQTTSTLSLLNPPSLPLLSPSLVPSLHLAICSLAYHLSDLCALDFYFFFALLSLPTPAAAAPSFCPVFPHF